MCWPLLCRRVAMPRVSLHRGNKTEEPHKQNRNSRHKDVICRVQWTGCRLATDGNTRLPLYGKKAQAEVTGRRKTYGSTRSADRQFNRTASGSGPPAKLQTRRARRWHSSPVTHSRGSVSGLGPNRTGRCLDSLSRTVRLHRSGGYTAISSSTTTFSVGAAV